jgi:hypothetical protein
MMNTLKLKWLTGVLGVMIALALVLSGCSSGDSTTQEIIDQTQAAANNITSYQFDYDMTIGLATQGLGSEDDVSMDLTGSGSGALDVKNKSGYMKLEMKANIPTMGEQTISIDYYVQDGWMYMKAIVPTMDEQWAKQKLEESVWQAQDQIAQHLALLKTAVQVDKVGTESVNGVGCDILAVKPDVKKIVEMINAMEKSIAGSGAEEFGLPTEAPAGMDMAKFFKQLSIKEWVAKDTHLIAKGVVDIGMEINEADIPAELTDQAGVTGTATPGAGQIKLDIAATINYHDYNKAVTVTVPPEALNAQEMSN